MRYFVSWLGEDGRVHSTADWTGCFDQALPAVGDVITQYFKDDDFYDAIEIVERCMASGHDDEQFWHFFVKNVTASQGGREVAKKAFESFAGYERELEAERARMGVAFAEIKRRVHK